MQTLRLDQQAASKMVRTAPTKIVTLLMMAVVFCATMLAGAATASAAPSFQVPFPCGQTWSGQTRSDHKPANAVDFNRVDDINDPVVAAAAGTVTLVRDLGGTSYGRYVVVDHGGGWSSLYAHLQTFSVSQGQAISRGARIGTVGSSGGSSGPHLHFEQRYNATAQRAVFNGSAALYFGRRSYTSNNGCGGAAGTVNTAGSPLTVRSGPGSTYPSVGSVSDGTAVTISCQAVGTLVSGTYGTSRLWDRIGSGRYVSDAYVNTGSDDQVAPTC